MISQNVKQTENDINKFHNKKIKLCLIGDIFGGDLYYKNNFGIHTKYFSKKAKGKIELNNFFKNQDIVLGNLESPFCKSEIISESFLGSMRFLEFLKRENIKFVTIANNHILDHGISKYEETKECLNLIGINFVGDSREYGSNFKIIEINNIKIGICGFSFINKDFIPFSYAQFDIKKIESTINKLKEYNSDFIIVSLHWGLEYINIPSLKQITDARKIVDMGANIIHCHHSHVILPYEKYNSSIIFYGMGNFIMDMSWYPPAKKGLVAFCEIDASKNIEITRLYKSFIKSNKIIFKSIENKNNYLINSRKLLIDNKYFIKQKRLHIIQKLLSYLFLLFNFYRLSPQTKKIAISGFKRKFRITKL